MEYVVGGITGLFLLAVPVTAVAGLADPATILMSGLAAIVLVTFIGVLAWGFPRMQANQLSLSPLYQGTVSGLITGQTVELQTETVEYAWDWEAFFKYWMSGAIILLYRSQQAMIVLPQSLVASDGDSQRLRDHVQATVPARMPWRPSFAFRLALGGLTLGLLWSLLGLLTEQEKDRSAGLPSYSRSRGSAASTQK